MNKNILQEILQFHNGKNRNTGRNPSIALRHSILSIRLFMVCFIAVVVAVSTVSAADISEDASALLQKGFDCYYSKDYSCMRTSFEKAHQLSPNESRILEIYSYALYYSKQNKEALEQFNTALALDPENPRLWMLKGRILKTTGNYFESGASFERAQAIEPRYTISLTDRFPFNLLVQTMWIIIGVIGFSLLGIYFYLREMRPRKYPGKK
jgi:tetratricopeptide (TPR) repeat protein